MMNKGSEMNGDPVKILVFGEVLWDLIRDGEYLGGAPFNLAAHLASCGIHSYIITNVGDDKRGRQVLKEMDRLGVDKTYVGVDPHHPTGTVNVALSQAGEPSYTINENVAYDFIELDDAQIEKIGNERFGAFCFGTLNQREETARRTLYRILDVLGDIHVFYDINLRQHYYSKEMIHKSLSRTTILKLNDDEVRMVSSLMFEEMLDDIKFARRIGDKYGIYIVLITLGKNGCAVYHDGAFESCPGTEVVVADTVGAGDRFCMGDSPMEAARKANSLGAFVASQQGAIPEYSEEITELLGL